MPVILDPVSKIGSMHKGEFPINMDPGLGISTECPTLFENPLAGQYRPIIPPLPIRLFLLSSGRHRSST
jgi:hypothetical protein